MIYKGSICEKSKKVTMIQKITFFFVVFLLCGMSCVSVTAIEANSNLEEIEPIPDVFTLHHLLNSQGVKDWIEQTERKVAETDKFLKEKRERHELAVVRLKDGHVIYQCAEGQYNNKNNSTGYLCCDQFLYDNLTWAIYPVNEASFHPSQIKHNVNATTLKNYWRLEINQFWNNSKQFLAGTVLDGKVIDPWCCDEYQDGHKYIGYYIAPRFKDENGNTWELSFSLQYSGVPDQVEEGCFYYNLGVSSFDVSARVLHERYALPINYDEFVLCPIVYHY